ncbi:MAG TPA: hypothetical protein VFC07_13640 [Verrucomicrobiae bacterium]|nr:hypothetical protein [Verrucomicrobiae bacterium]
MKRTLVWVATLILLGACGTTSPLVDWNRRIGHYSYDLALEDLGVPMRSTTLNDGSIVADWQVRRSTPGADTQTDFATQVSLESPFPNAAPPLPNQYLRLTFGPDQQLTGWQRYGQYYE